MLNLIKYKNNLGFTLVEVLVASAIFIAALTVMYGIYFSGLDIYNTANYQADLQAQARIALNSMSYELRNATRTSTQNPSPNLSIPSTPNNKSTKFYLPAKDINGRIVTDSGGDIVWDKNNPIDYQYIPGQKVLRRLENGEQKILAQDVSGIQFIDANIDYALSIYELKIILTLNKTTPEKRNISVTSSAIVRLRN